MAPRTNTKKIRKAGASCCSQNLRNGIFPLSDFISLQCYILYIFIHAEQKCGVIEAAMGAEEKLLYIRMHRIYIVALCNN